MVTLSCKFTAVVIQATNGITNQFISVAANVMQDEYDQNRRFLEVLSGKFLELRSNFALDAPTI